MTDVPIDPSIELRFSKTAQSTTLHRLIRTHALDTKSVLDLGCTYGEFLIHFGPGSVGFTVSELEASYGQMKGLDVRVGNVEASDFKLEKKFDAVYANNLLEHLYSPHNFLRKLSTLIHTDGKIIIGVPCIPKIVSLMKAHRRFQGSLADAHINFFTKETLVKTIERGGWIVEAVRGYHVESALLDNLASPIYPHFYVVARMDPNFAYSEKRQNELAGYADMKLDLFDAK